MFATEDYFEYFVFGNQILGLILTEKKSETELTAGVLKKKKRRLKTQCKRLKRALFNRIKQDKLKQIT